jgi:hypothetical protein
LDYYLEVDAGDVGRQHFLFELVLFNHKLEIYVDILAALSIDYLFFLLLPLRFLHLQAALLSIFLDLFYLLQVPSLLIVRLHI